MINTSQTDHNHGNSTKNLLKNGEKHLKNPFRSRYNQEFRLIEKKTIQTPNTHIDIDNRQSQRNNKKIQSETKLSNDRINEANRENQKSHTEINIPLFKFHKTENFPNDNF